MPDVASAGSGCINSVAFPHSDPWADAEINTTSHEQQEAVTDADGDGWICTTGCTGTAVSTSSVIVEIGDMCNFDFPGIQPDNSNVRLGPDGGVGDPYRLQTEWSNSNNGCTLDVGGAPSRVTEAISPDTSTKVAASPQNFVIHFKEAGESVSAATVIKGFGASPVTFFVTPSSTVSTVPNRGTEAWCFDTKCTTQVQSVTGPVSLSYYYYQMVVEQPYMRAIGGFGIFPQALIHLCHCPFLLHYLQQGG